MWYSPDYAVDGHWATPLAYIKTEPAGLDLNPSRPSSVKNVGPRIHFLTLVYKTCDEFTDATICYYLI